VNNKFCANPLCELNKFDNNTYGSIVIEKHKNAFELDRKVVRNFPYRNDSNTIRFNLCEVCHKAVELVCSKQSI